MKLPPEFRLKVLVRTVRYWRSLLATITFSSASRQFAAFHQPVVSYKPAALYHCWRRSVADSLFALKSSPGMGLEEPPLTAKMAALAPLLPDCQVTMRFVTGLDALPSGISAA